jgi:excinuclease UvrABC nuclease subunit
VGTVDVIGIAVEGDRAAVQAFPLRDGRLVDRYGFHLENAAGSDITALVEAFCGEYYGTAPSVPPEIVVPRHGGDLSGLGAFLSERRGSRVVVRPASPGEKRRLQELAAQKRRHRAPVGRREIGAAAVAPRRGAGGALGVPQPREPADLDRVLRHLHDPGE